MTKPKKWMTKWQIRKKLGPQIAILQIATFAEFRKSNKLVSPQVCEFVICELFADRPVKRIHSKRIEDVSTYMTGLFYTSYFKRWVSEV